MGYDAVRHCRSVPGALTRQTRKHAVLVHAVPRDTWPGLSKNSWPSEIFSLPGVDERKNLFLYKLFFEFVVSVTCHRRRWSAAGAFPRPGRPETSWSRRCSGPAAPRHPPATVLGAAQLPAAPRRRGREPQLRAQWVGRALRRAVTALSERRGVKTLTPRDKRHSGDLLLHTLSPVPCAARAARTPTVAGGTGETRRRSSSPPTYTT